MAWKVSFFQTARGDYPVAKFTSKMVRLRRKSWLSRIIETTARSNLYQKIQSKLYELRISGKIAVRFYTIYHEEFYLLHAFKRKRRKPAEWVKVALDD